MTTARCCRFESVSREVACELLITVDLVSRLDIVLPVFMAGYGSAWVLEHVLVLERQRLAVA